MRCLICNSENTHNVGPVNGYVEGDIFNVHECLDCNVSWVMPLKSNDSLYNSIYKNAQRVVGYSRYWQLAEQIANKEDPLKFIANQEDCYHAVIEVLKDEQKYNRDLRIIELGCGQGYLTYALSKAGFNITGVDLSQEAVDLATTRFGNRYFCGTINSFVSHANQLPTTVICTELIEHLEDPIGFVQTIIDFLGPGGKLVLTTPNKIIGRKTYWDTDQPPVHLWWFSKDSLIIIAERVGCNIEFFNFDNFYLKHGITREFNTPAPTECKPIFDKSMNIITGSIQNDSLWKRAKKLIIPNFLSRANKRRKDNMRGREQKICDDASSYTICAILTKN